MQRSPYKRRIKFPGGLLNTALAIECFQPAEGRDDESIYETLNVLGNRSKYSPVSANGVVISDDKDTVRIARLIDAANNAASTLELIRQSSSTHNDACNAWNEMFCHSYFDSIKFEEKVNSELSLRDEFTDGWLYNIKRFGILYAVKFPTSWSHVARPIWEMENGLDLFVRAGVSKLKNENVSSIENGEIINRGLWVKFEAKGMVPFSKDFNVMWRVVNTGEQAKYRDSLRGGFYPSNNGVIRWEQTQYRGVHWVEAFAIRKRNNVCVGKSERFFVVIE